mgnify:FL=1
MMVKCETCIHTTKRLSQVLFANITILGCLISIFDTVTQSAGLAAAPLWIELAYVFLFSKMSHGLCWANAVLVLLVNVVTTLVARCVAFALQSM